MPNCDGAPDCTNRSCDLSFHRIPKKRRLEKEMGAQFESENSSKKHLCLLGSF